MTQEDWEHRREGESTSEYLGRVLEDYLELPIMARRARLGHFNEYADPDGEMSDEQILLLVRELKIVSRRLARIVAMHQRTLKVTAAVQQGEFDVTHAELKERSTPELDEILFGYATG